MITNVHDNEIINYKVDFKKNEITFETIDVSDKTVMIVFKDVLVHQFETEMPNSIIFDIEKYDLEKMVKDNKELLEQKKAFCWPPIGDYNDTDDLIKKLKNDKYNYYIIESSLGLSGWVLAKSLQVN